MGEAKGSKPLLAVVFPVAKPAPKALRFPSCPLTFSLRKTLGNAMPIETLFQLGKLNQKKKMSKEKNISFKYVKSV